MVDPILKPKALQKGQLVGLVAPASHLDSNERINIAVETLESLGFRVQEGTHLRERFGYFAGTDVARASDVNAMFSDPEICGIVCLTGGWGSSRTLPHLEFDLIRKNPKVLLGFSDITALLNGIFAKTNLITFHGLVADIEFSPYALEEFKRIVMQAEKEVLLGSPPPFEPAEGRVERKNRVVTMKPGIARGRLVGGNLTLVSHLIGTPYLPSLDGTILFLEDTNEQVYRIDRMLNQIWLSGCASNLSGVIFGKFTDCLPSPHRAMQFTLDQVLSDFTERLHVPSISGLMIGHVTDQATLPIGCMAELNANNGTLRLLEAAVE
jgi:muramoyltetrapeptide carboxypeptidase